MANLHDAWGGAWGNSWLTAWTKDLDAVVETFSGGYFTKKDKPKEKSSYQIQMEGLAQLPIINRHYPLPLEVDKLIEKVSIEEDSEEEDIKAIMLLIH